MPESGTGLVWHDWGVEAFRHARAQDRPIILALTASWCQGSHDMDREAYRDASVGALIADRFVPIRVDADRRPDVFERYQLGGLPTTAFLTPAGDLLGGGTYLDPSRLVDGLLRTSDAFRTRRGEIDARVQQQARNRQRRIDSRAAVRGSAGTMADELVAQSLEVFDEDHAGFGTAPKFPHCQVLELFVARWRAAPDGRLRDVVIRTLDAIGWGGLHDEVEGGFFRYARGRDWTAPQLEKVLETNARLLRVYLEAGIAFDERRYIDRTAGVVAFVQSRLAEGPEGGFFIGRKTDPQYYDLASPAERRARSSPPCDTALYTDANAEMAGAYLALGAWLRDASLFDFGLQTLERVILATYRPGLGLAHACGGHTGVRGLLVDHVRAVDALLEAHRGTENLVYVEMAEELMHYCHRVMWDEAVGGFFDRASERDEPELGLLAEPLKPFVLNCEAARTLFRLATVSGDSRFADRARAALVSQASGMPGAGLLGAAYGLAVADAGGRA